MLDIEKQASELIDQAVAPLNTQEITQQPLNQSVPVSTMEEQQQEEYASQNNNIEEAIEPVIETTSNINSMDPVNAILATRNMLRSRKKELDQTVKKPHDAIERQVKIEKNSVSDSQKSEVDKKKQERLPAPQKAYHEDNIDPTVIRKANQVDKWAHMIDAMELTARIRQLAIHATIGEDSTDEHLILLLDQATKHLITDVAHQQLQEQVSQFLSREVKVTLDLVDKTISDPYQIQSHINDKRYDYAKELLQKDEIVTALQEKFEATLDENTIVAR